MEDMIINPMWIYAIETIDNFGFALRVAIVVCVGAMLIVYLCKYDEEEMERLARFRRITEFDTMQERETTINEYIEWADKIIKRGIVAIVTMLVICIFIPSKQTMYAMLVSSYITKQNVEILKGDITKSVDYIFEKIKAVKGK